MLDPPWFILTLLPLMKSLRLLGLLLVAVLGSALVCRAEKFTLVVLPDTQTSVNYRPQLFKSQVRWIVGHQEKRNIQFVLHVGDLVDWTDDYQWANADECMAVLDRAQIPYAIAVGNHDTAAVTVGGHAAPGDVRANLRDTTLFNRYFPPERFRNQAGVMEPGKSDNNYAYFSAGGVDWLVLTLELWARQEVIDWAKTVVAKHPHHNVIVLTHSHLERNGTIKQNNGGYGHTSPQHMWNELLSRYPNILLVLSGHVQDSAWRADEGVHGNKVYQLLQNYQGQDRGGGYMRLLEVDTEARKISARMYSSYYDKTLADHSRFVIEDVNFIPPAKR